MSKFLIHQSNRYKAYIILPKGWLGKHEPNNSWTSKIINWRLKIPNGTSYTDHIFGPNKMYMNIEITSLKEAGPELSLEDSEKWFEGFAYRQNLFDESTSKINVLSKDHFTATYWRINHSGAQYIKKYCLYIDEQEYLTTAILADILRGEDKPNHVLLSYKETIYDTIVKSFNLEMK